MLRLRTWTAVAALAAATLAPPAAAQMSLGPNLANPDPDAWNTQACTPHPTIPGTVFCL